MNRKMVSIKGLKKEVVLKALYDGSHLQGLGFLSAISSFSIEDAEKCIKENPEMHFDYLYGRVLKVDLSEDYFDPRLYDRDCGEGRAQKQIDKIMKGEYGYDVFSNM